MSATRFAPVWRFATRKARECARLTARVRQLELETAILRAHLRLARRALTIATDSTAVVEQAVTIALGGEWSAADASWAVNYGIDVER